MSLKLQTDLPASIEKFIRCAQAPNDDVYQTLKPDILDNSLTADRAKWHKMSYNIYTSNENILHVAPQEPDEYPTPEETIDTPKRRSAESTTNWELCLFCQRGK